MNSDLVPVTASFQVRQLLSGQEEPDRAGLARFSADEAPPLQHLDHVVDSRGRDTEVALHIGLRGRAAEELGVIVDEGKELALAGCVVGGY